MPITPKLGEDKLLSVEEALKLMKERAVDKSDTGKALFNLVRKRNVRVWLTKNGELYYQYNPEEAKGELNKNVWLWEMR
jgi:hypothetical protein